MRIIPLWASPLATRLLGIAGGCGLLLATGACNLNKLTAETTSGALLHGSVAMDREADIEFARYAFPASLKTLETFLVNAPENEELLLLLARGYNAYAFGFPEGDMERADVAGEVDEATDQARRARLHYLRGSEYGFRLLGAPAVREAAQQGELERLKSELAKLEASDAPALFWAGYGWASAINLSLDDPAMLSSLSAVEAIMARVYELDSSYNAGAPVLFQAVYNASRPAALGGKPEVAKQFFEEAMATYGDENLLVPYMYARTYCVQTQNRDCFDQNIAKVLETDVTAAPDLRLNNEIARARARFWADHVDSLILE